MLVYYIFGNIASFINDSNNAFFYTGGVVCGEVLSCDSCGRECAAACGTRQFRTCCFNYLRKRTAPMESEFVVDPSLRLELWLARSRGVPTGAMPSPYIAARHSAKVNTNTKLQAGDLNYMNQYHDKKHQPDEQNAVDSNDYPIQSAI